MSEGIRINQYDTDKIGGYFPNRDQSFKVLGVLILSSGILYGLYRYLSGILIPDQEIPDKYKGELIHSKGIDRLHDEDKSLVRLVLDKLIPKETVLVMKGDKFNRLLKEVMKDYDKVTIGQKVHWNCDVYKEIDKLITKSTNFQTLGFFEMHRGYFINKTVYFGGKGLKGIPYDSKRGCFPIDIHDPMKHLAGIRLRFFYKTKVISMRKDLDDGINCYWVNHCRNVVRQHLEMILRYEKRHREFSIDYMIESVQPSLKDSLYNEPLKICKRVFELPIESVFNGPKVYEEKKVFWDTIEPNHGNEIESIKIYMKVPLNEVNEID